MQLFSGRSSAHHWWVNQHRLLLSALAYPLRKRMRSLSLHGIRLAPAEFRTFRVRLLKIGAVISRLRILVRNYTLHEICGLEFDFDEFLSVPDVFAISGGE